MGASLARLSEARDGSFRVVLLAGDPGSGKSAMLESLSASAQEQGALVLMTECSTAVESGLVLRRLLVQAKAHAASPPDGRGSSGEPTDDEARELQTALKELSEARPIAILIDGSESIGQPLGEHLNETAHALAQAPVLLVLASRWPVPGDCALAVQLRHFRLQGTLLEIPLPPLDRAGSDRLVREVAKEIPVPPAFCESVHAVARGNPRFTVELVKAAVAHARPRGLRLDDVDLAAVPPTPALLERFAAAVSSLLDEERKVIEAAAAHGPRFSVRSLELALGATAGSLAGALERLVRAGVIIGQGEDRYAFSLPQFAATIYDSLTEDGRKDLHSRLAAAIAAITEAGDDRYLGDLGRHHALSGDFAKAYTAYSRAAEKAEEVGDADGALQSFNLALKVLRAYRRLDIEAIAQLRLSAATEAEVEGALHRYIRNALEREPRSRAFLDEVRGAPG